MKIFHTHLYLQLRNIFAFKKYSTFANLSMEEPDNLFATVKIRIKHPKETKFKKRNCIFTQKFLLGKSSVPA